LRAPETKGQDQLTQNRKKVTGPVPVDTSDGGGYLRTRKENQAQTGKGQTTQGIRKETSTTTLTQKKTTWGGGGHKPHKKAGNVLKGTARDLPHRSNA